MACVGMLRLCCVAVCLTLTTAYYKHPTSQGSLWQPMQANQVSNALAGIGGMPGFVPPDVGAIYCAYCRRRGWTDCINRYCHNRSTFFPPSFPTNGIAPTGRGFLGATGGQPFGFRRFRNNIGSPMRMPPAYVYYKKIK